MFGINLKSLVITNDIKFYNKIENIVKHDSLSVKLECSKTDVDISAKLKHVDVVICDCYGAHLSLLLELHMMLKKKVCFVFEHKNIKNISYYKKIEATVVVLNGETQEDLVNWIKEERNRVIIERWIIRLLLVVTIGLLLYFLYVWIHSSETCLPNARRWRPTRTGNAKLL